MSTGTHPLPPWALALLSSSIGMALTLGAGWPAEALAEGPRRDLPLAGPEVTRDGLPGRTQP